MRTAEPSVLVEFLRAAEACVQAEGDIEPVMEPFLRLLSKERVAEVLGWHLERLAEEPLHQLAGGSTHAIAEADHVSLTVTLLSATPAGTDPGPRLVEAAPADRLLGVAGPAPVEVELYRLPPSSRLDVFDPDLTIELAGARLLEPGTAVMLRAGADLIALRPSERASALLQVSRLQPQVPFRWAFDRDTRRAVHLAAADPETVRLEYLMFGLSAMGAEQALPVLSDLFTHPLHSVRWGALRAVMDLDPEQGMAMLERAVLDPHPHVARAARSALGLAEDSDGPDDPS